MIFVYTAEPENMMSETGKLVYNKAVRHAFESEGEDLDGKSFKEI